MTDHHPDTYQPEGPVDTVRLHKMEQNFRHKEGASMMLLNYAGEGVHARVVTLHFADAMALIALARLGLASRLPNQDDVDWSVVRDAIVDGCDEEGIPGPKYLQRLFAKYGIVIVEAP